MLLGQGGRLALQAGYFVLIARALGPQGYGAFVGVVALVGILAPFSTWGAGQLLVQHVARHPERFRAQWGKALVITLVSGLFFLAAVVLLWRQFLPGSMPAALVVSVAVSDLLFARLVDLSSQAYQAVERLGRTAKIQVLVSLLKFLAAFFWVMSGAPAGATQWGVLYLVATALAGIGGVIWASLELGRPDFHGAWSDWEIREGWHFSLGLSAQTIYNDIDKTLLARLSTLEATGIYGAAYRLIDVAFVPVRSLLSASYARFFQAGQKGISGSLALARKLLPIGAGYSLLATLCILLGAGLAPMLLGREYASTTDALRLLAPLPLLKAFHYFAADSITGAGYQRWRTIAQVSIAILNVLLCFWLIPAYSWQGAAWASLASDGLLAVGLWGLVAILVAAERDRARSAESVQA